MDGPATIVHDFNVGVQYRLNSNYGTCKVEPITAANSYFDASLGDDGQYHLKDSRHLFLIDQFDFVYEGVKNDSVVLDAWIGYRNDSIVFSNVTIMNSVYQIFMSRPGQVLLSTHGMSVGPFPWQASFSGSFSYELPNGTAIKGNFSDTSFLYDFAMVEPPFDAFDVSSCFKETDFVMLVFRLPGHIYGVDQISFRGSIRVALVDYAKSIGKPFITPLQISAIQVRGHFGLLLLLCRCMHFGIM